MTSLGKGGLWADPLPEPRPGPFAPFPTSCLMLPPQVTKSTTNPDELGILANQLTTDYGHLALQAKPAALTAENEEVREGMRVGGGEDLGGGLSRSI